MDYKCPECGYYLIRKSFVHSTFCCDNGQCSAWQYGKVFTKAYCEMHLTGANDVKRVEVRALANNTVMEIKFHTLARRGWFKDNIEPIVNIIKTQIPSTQRSYDPQTYKWEIAMEFWMPIQVVLESFGFSIKHLAETADSGPTVPKDYAENFYNEPAPFANSVPTEDIRAGLFEFLGLTTFEKDPKNLKSLYRTAARQLHPDLGGDAAKMSELNRLWSLYNA